jgi:hypothetical protein
MKQSDLNRAVARRTGESVSLVRQRGFTILAPFPPVLCAEPAGDACCSCDAGDGPAVQAGDLPARNE